MDNKLEQQLINNLINTINEISSITNYPFPIKKQFTNLSRRLMLLIPFFEEINDNNNHDHHTFKNLSLLYDSLVKALDLLHFASLGSKIYLALEREQLMTRFNEVTSKLEQALDGISYEKLEISEEIKEQVDLVLAQFRRAKGRVDEADEEFDKDLLSLYDKRKDADADADQDVVKRVAEKLQLMKIDELTHESVALTEMVFTTGGDPDERIENMCTLLKKIKDFVQTENPNLESFTKEEKLSDCGQTSSVGSPKSILIPDDFRCPISLELMSDPVIVSTGQTYERSCIEKWIKRGHNTCPKTQLRLQGSYVTPNYALRSLIEQWCEANGIEPPKRASTSHPHLFFNLSPTERLRIEALLCKLTSSNLEEERCGAGEIRLLAKFSADNRVAIAEAGAIPLLVNLLSTSDSQTQEHAVTALLNLSICDDNKCSIIYSGALPGIVHVLKTGSMEARENAAATLFSLSIVDENKVVIGSSGVISPLVMLLRDGTRRGKKDSASALFNLCIYQGNKGKAVRAGIIPILIGLLMEPESGLLDEALAILAILASHTEGKAAIMSVNALPVLVNLIANGSPRNKENATAVLVQLCVGDHSYLAATQELGIMDPLLEMAQNGTERGKRKAQQLIERLNRYGKQQKVVETTAEAQGHILTAAEGG